MNGGREKLFLYLFAKARKEKLFNIWNKVFHLYCIYILGFEFESKTKVGTNFAIVHGARGSVINPNSIIGNNCTVRNNTIIGNKGFEGGSPVIGDNVNIGANVCIIGEITIGNNVIIGAGSVVVRDVPDNVVIAGNPAKIIRYL